MWTKVPPQPLLTQTLALALYNPNPKPSPNPNSNQGAHRRAVRHLLPLLRRGHRQLAPAQGVCSHTLNLTPTLTLTLALTPTLTPTLTLTPYNTGVLLL